MYLAVARPAAMSCGHGHRQLAKETFPKNHSYSLLWIDTKMQKVRRMPID